MVGYLLLAVTILSAVHGLVKLLKWYGDETQRITQRLHYGAAAILLVIALQSTGQLTLRDVIALVPLTALAFWYFGLRRPKLATVPVASIKAILFYNQRRPRYTICIWSRNFRPCRPRRLPRRRQMAALLLLCLRPCQMPRAPAVRWRQLSRSAAPIAPTADDSDVIEPTMG